MMYLLVSNTPFFLIIYETLLDFIDRSLEKLGDHNNYRVVNPPGFPGSLPDFDLYLYLPAKVRNLPDFFNTNKIF